MKKSWMIWMLAAWLLLAGCATQTQMDGSGSTEDSASVSEDTQSSREIFAMDTYMTLTAYGENGEKAIEAAVQEIERLDALLSIGTESSEITKLNTVGSGVLSEDSATLVSQALELYHTTGGAFDITVLPLMRLWGFTDQNYRVPSADELEQTLRCVGSDQLTYDEKTKQLTLGEGQSIDLGGIAKGYTSGRVMDIFRSYGVVSGMVSLGGNVHVLGSKTDGTAWRVGIQNPDNSEDIAGVLAVIDRAVITSGGYERYFEQDGVTYHHILDPSTGKPAQSGLASVTIVSENGTRADGLSTALFVMGQEKAIAYWRQHTDEFDAVLISADGEIAVTEGIFDQFSSDQTIQKITGE